MRTIGNKFILIYIFTKIILLHEKKAAHEHLYNYKSHNSCKQ